MVFEEIFGSKLEYSCFKFGEEKSKDYMYFPLVGTDEGFSSYQDVLNAYI